MPRRKANVNLADARRIVRACKLEGIHFRATLQPGGAVIFESAAGMKDVAPEPETSEFTETVVTKRPRSARRLPQYTSQTAEGRYLGLFLPRAVLSEESRLSVQMNRSVQTYEAAEQRVETVLLPAFDAWRTGGASEAPTLAVAAFGTLDWMFGEYRSDRRYTKLDGKSKRNHENGFKLVGGYVLKDGKSGSARNA